jgi:3-dehydroquinate synthase
MKQLLVDLGERSYPILIGDGLLARLAEQLEKTGVTNKQRILVVTDEHVAPFYLQQVLEHLTERGFRCSEHIVAAGEKAKTLRNLEQVTTSALQAGLDRKSMILALGGGVVGDLAGFAAATYMRGIAYAQIPTTLLAHDSSVGGKVAVNHPLAKNIIGAFHQPSFVLYDTSTLRTLPRREVAAGFAEVVKHGLIWSETFTAWLEAHADDLFTLQSPWIDEAIFAGCQIKSQVVSEDEREHGRRAILNLGHTFGHAMEALSHYGELIHGEAVSIGMVGASLLSERIGLSPLENELSKTTISLLKKFHLPVCMPDFFDPVEMIEVMRRDKKGSQGKLVFVLPKQVGAVEVVNDIAEQDVFEVLKMLKEVE